MHLLLLAHPARPSPATARPRAPSGGAAPAFGGHREAPRVEPRDRPGAWRPDGSSRPERRFGPRPRASAAGTVAGSCGARDTEQEAVSPWAHSGLRHSFGPRRRRRRQSGRGGTEPMEGATGGIWQHVALAPGASVIVRPERACLGSRRGCDRELELPGSPGSLKSSGPY
ncbi:hypothetical protein NDU88_009483 [Pleurodeles waltl]|uniref:Uncharacterized protein n=1 Tax=Pleurodeles waltl TaxID=8319 RepID=A0AAV7PVY3_PLEWA|nr:hypothetical protein NDU88_009483 [Pleurodeles waltl]